jgi:asparagine synthetase B (glutamine-hydrolysing)
MVLSGEGADEVFAGYLYFHKAPNGEELHKETVRKVWKRDFEKNSISYLKQISKFGIIRHRLWNIIQDYENETIYLVETGWETELYFFAHQKFSCATVEWAERTRV